MIYSFFKKIYEKNNVKTEMLLNLLSATGLISSTCTINSDLVKNM